MVKRITALQARQNLGEILEGVYHRGDRFVIERAGKAMAAVVPLDALSERDALDDDLAGALEDARSGRLYGPFGSGSEVGRSVREPAPRPRKKTAKRR